MPKCAKCDTEYAAEYDGCPNCAGNKKASTGRWWIIGLALATVVSFALPWFGVTIVLAIATVIVTATVLLRGFFGGIKAGMRE